MRPLEERKERIEGGRERERKGEKEGGKEGEKETERKRGREGREERRKKRKEGRSKTLKHVTMFHAIILPSVI